MNPSKRETNAIEPGQSWEVDLFRPGDAVGVAGLFRSVYGEGYPIRTYVDPERLIAENGAGRIISSVARTPKGDIVGHTALFQSAPYPGIRESGAGAVHANYRGGKGIFTNLCAHGIEVAAREFGVEAVYGESVCNHVFTQKMTHSLGCVSQAVEVDLMPASAYEHEKSAPGRVASILDFKTIRPKPHAVYLPSAYEKALRFIYKGLDDQRDIAVSMKNVPTQRVSRVETRYFDFAQVARVAVPETGADFSQVFDRKEKEARERGSVVIQVWLNLSQPRVGEAVAILMEKGYFLGGVLPRWFDSDGLLMQRIWKVPDFDTIQLHFDRAKRILELVKADWARAMASS
jgi:hypothetical protein